MCLHPAGAARLAGWWNQAGMISCLVGSVISTVGIADNSESKGFLTVVGGVLSLIGAIQIIDTHINTSAEQGDSD